MIKLDALYRPIETTDVVKELTLLLSLEKADNEALKSRCVKLAKDNARLELRTLELQTSLDYMIDFGYRA